MWNIAYPVKQGRKTQHFSTNESAYQIDDVEVRIRVNSVYISSTLRILKSGF